MDSYSSEANWKIKVRAPGSKKWKLYKGGNLSLTKKSKSGTYLVKLAFSSTPGYDVLGFDPKWSTAKKIKVTGSALSKVTKQSCQPG